jgi:hypothetical protein
MLKNRKRALIIIILLWCSYLFLLQDSVRTFIADLRYLDFLEQDVIHASQPLSYNWAERAYSTQRRLIYIVVSNLWILALIIWLTRNCFKALKKKDVPQSENAWLLSKGRKKMLVISTIVGWCYYLLFCHLTVQTYITDRHVSQLMTRIAEDKDMPGLTEGALSSILDTKQSIIHITIYNLFVLTMVILLTKTCFDAFKKNDDSSDGNQLAQS